MSSTETEILTRYLAQPAPLTAAITVGQFLALFPPAVRSGGEQALRSLYRDLQSQRGALIVDTLVANIAEEARRGAVMRREVLRLRRGEAVTASAAAAADPEIDMERALFGDGRGARHTLPSIVPELLGASEALEADIDHLRQEEAALLASLEQTVGGLSDLRYGKLANTQLREEVLSGLDSLEQACQDKS